MKTGDWQISNIGGKEPFLLHQMGEDSLLHYKGSLSTESEVQSFAKGHELTLAETLPTCPGPSRNYVRVGQTDPQAPLYTEVDLYREKQGEAVVTVHQV